MGDKRRFDLFADFIARNLPRDARIADVAAGKGQLSFALRRRGFKFVTPYEPRHRRGAGGQVRRLGLRVEHFTGGDFDAIVGMHPDEATDVILDEAARTRAVAIVCPCCPKPARWITGQHTRETWIAHLVRESRRRGLSLNQTALPMMGANVVLWGKR